MILRPSSAATWVVCHGQPSMRAAYPEAPEESDNEVREDGTAAHWLANEIWHHRTPPLNSLSPNQRTLDEEMFDCVDMYLDVLRSWTNVAPVVERTLDCSVIHAGMTGTPDAWAYDPSTNTIHIADFKYGFRFVEAWDNWQMICYAAAIMDNLGINGLHDQTLMVEMTIVQPRCSHRDGPVRTWKVRASDLRGHINILRDAAAKAMQPNAPCQVNPGCGDCPARHACVTLQNSALGAIETSYAGVPVELNAAAAGDELRRLKEASKRIEARITGLEGQVESLLRKGTVVPYWSLEPSYARERWRDGVESQLLTLAQYYNADVAKPRAPISPAQARKVLPADVVAMFAHKPSTGVKLTPSDPLQARKRFAKP